MTITYPSDPSIYQTTPWTDQNGKQWIADAKGRFSEYVEVVSAVAIADSSPQTFYIVHRADGLVGSGTQSDPWDGSTAARATAAVNAALLTYTAPRTCIIQFGTGIFDLDNYHLPVHFHIVMQGVGREMTTLRRNANFFFGTANENYAVIYCGDIDANVKSLHVKDMTIDANWNNCLANSPAINADGRQVSSLCIRASSNAARISNVRFKGCGCSDTLALVEVWGVGLFGGTLDFKESVVEGCIFEEPHTGKINPIAIVSDPVWIGPNAESNGVIQNCLVYGGVTAFYAKMILGCESRGSQHGVFADSHNALKGMVIANSRFLDCKGGGVILNTNIAGTDPVINGLIITGNVITCHASASTFFGVSLINTYASSPDNITISNSIVANNVIRGAAGANRYGLYADKAYGVTFTGNKVSSALTNVITSGSNVLSIDNTDEHNVELVGFPNVSPHTHPAAAITGLSALATNTDAANLTGNVARARLDNALSANPAPGAFTALSGTTGTFSGLLKAKSSDSASNTNNRTYLQTETTSGASSFGVRDAAGYWWLDAVNTNGSTIVVGGFLGVPTGGGIKNVNAGGEITARSDGGFDFRDSGSNVRGTFENGNLTASGTVKTGSYTKAAAIASSHATAIAAGDGAQTYISDDDKPAWSNGTVWKLADGTTLT